MMKKKPSRIIFRYCIIALLLFPVLLILWSANWFVVKFEDLDISVALYQIVTPLKGTSNTVIFEYIEACVVPSIGVVLIAILMLYTYDVIVKNMLFTICIKIDTKQFRFVIQKRKLQIIRGIISLIIVIILFISLIQTVNMVKLPKFIRSITNKSNFYETNYVDPNNVNISVPDKKRNLIIIYMESVESTYASIDAGGACDINYIPELTELARTGVNFSNTDLVGGGYCLQGASWTIAALLAYQTGITFKLPVTSVSNDTEFLPGVKGMGEILEDSGYKNYFLCGSDTSFGGRRALLRDHGNFEIFDYLTAKEEGFIPSDYYEFWGMEDEKLYEYAKLKLDSIAKRGEPFNISLLTVDTHFSQGYICEKCQNKYSNQYANVISCASKQVSEFIEWASQQDWYDNTTIVIVGDHLSMNDDFFENIKGADRRIYNCFYNLPYNLSNCNYKNREFNTTDMLPTILASLNIEIDGERLGLGTNLFSDKPTLQEQLGSEELTEQLSLYSDYYFDKFVMNK